MIKDFKHAHTTEYQIYLTVYTVCLIFSKQRSSFGAYIQSSDKKSTYCIQTLTNSVQIHDIHTLLMGTKCIRRYNTAKSRGRNDERKLERKKIVKLIILLIKNNPMVIHIHFEENVYGLFSTFVVNNKICINKITSVLNFWIKIASWITYAKLWNTVTGKRKDRAY